nr:hypothetical protein GTC16762_31530 [Pigmentibacter ruber]
MFDYIFCQFKHIIDSKWTWDTAWYFITAIGTWVAAIGTVGTLIFLACPTIKKYYIKQKLDKRLNTFFKEYSKNKEHGKDQKSLFIMNFDAVQDTIFNPEKSDKIQKLNFFKNQNIVALEKDIKINNVKIKSGFHFYEIISDNCIRVDFFLKIMN